MSSEDPLPKLELGQLVATANAVATLHPDDVITAVGRHARGDWGELDEHDRLENERSLLAEPRALFHAFAVSTGATAIVSLKLF